MIKPKSLSVFQQTKFTFILVEMEK